MADAYSQTRDLPHRFHPEQLRVYNGEVEVRAAQGEPVTVKAGETLPLADILVPEQTLGPPGDAFNEWAFKRSEAVAADNADRCPDCGRSRTLSELSDGLASAGYTYFPPTMGYPYMGYGTYATWSPYTSSYPGYGYRFRLWPGHEIYFPSAIFGLWWCRSAAAALPLSQRGRLSRRSIPHLAPGSSSSPDSAPDAHHCTPYHSRWPSLSWNGDRLAACSIHRPGA